MSSPTPLQSFLGGIGISLPVYALLVLNGSVLGVSGFVHRTIRGSKEPVAAIAGLILGGIAVGGVERVGPGLGVVGNKLWPTILSGLLVGVGTRMSNGCTSGHMVSGLSRFSFRSFVATATFFSSGVLTAGALYRGSLPAVGPADWTVGQYGKTFLALQVLPLAISGLLYVLAPPEKIPSGESKPLIANSSDSSCDTSTITSIPHTSLRLLASLTTSFNFAVALRLSNLTDPLRVVSFLLLPFDKAFDPSLFFLGLSGVPLSMLLYHLSKGKDTPRLGGEWSVPESGVVDVKLVIGAAIFGVGWAISGVCPGPGLVNLGRALFNGSNITSTVAWIASVAVGGLLLYWM